MDAPGLDHDLPALEASKAWKQRRTVLKPMAPEITTDIPVMQSTMSAKDVDLSRFPSPIWHQHDGGQGS
jgi:3-polyprenyl-4-hydroxybenzoate decarboxylase